MKIYLKESDGSWKLYEGDLASELAKRDIVSGQRR